DALPISASVATALAPLRILNEPSGCRFSHLSRIERSPPRDHGTSGVRIASPATRAAAASKSSRPALKSVRARSGAGTSGNLEYRLDLDGEVERQLRCRDGGARRQAGRPERQLDRKRLLQASPP